MSQPLKKVTLNASAGKIAKADRQGMKRRREPENTAHGVDGNDSKIGDTIFPSDGLANGPTSFAGLIPSDNAEGTRPARRIKTFQDVSAAAANATAAGAFGAMLPLSQSDWLPPIMAPRPPKANGAADAQAGHHTAADANPAAAAATHKQILGIELDNPPVDWSLKTSLRFTSPHPFNLVHAARTAPRSEVIDAERSFTACIGDTGLTPHQRLLAAAMSWQFPQNPQPPASSRPLVGTSLPSHIQQRRKDWQESLCSLYDALRTGQCSAFYVVSPQLPSGIGKQPFTVLFTAASVKGSKRLQAVMGTSSAGVRSVLKMQGVEFDTPLVISSSNTNANTSRSTASSIDHTTRSMLVFNGALQVHALFDFLLNRVFTLLDNVCDVPILLAPVQFTHAAIKKFTLTATAAVAAGPSSKGKANAGGGVKAVHTLDVKGGIIPGWVADRMLRALTSDDSDSAATAASACLTMVSTPLPASVALNWHSTKTNNKKDDVPLLQCFGGCVSEDEAKRWCTTLEGLDTAAVREMKFSVTSGGKGRKSKTYQIVQATPRILPISI